MRERHAAYDVTLCLPSLLSHEIFVFFDIASYYALPHCVAAPWHFYNLTKQSEHSTAQQSVDLFRDEKKERRQKKLHLTLLYAQM